MGFLFEPKGSRCQALPPLPFLLLCRKCHPEWMPAQSPRRICPCSAYSGLDLSTRRSEALGAVSVDTGEDSMLPESEVEGDGEEGLGETRGFVDKVWPTGSLSLFSSFVASSRPLKRDGSLGPNLLGKLFPHPTTPHTGLGIPWGPRPPQSLSQMGSHLSHPRVQAKISSRPVTAIDPLGHRQGVAGCSSFPRPPSSCFSWLCHGLARKLGAEAESGRSSAGFITSNDPTAMTTAY